ncbi:MAG TPA: transporter substrate-binding domain-containing protein [Actinomycetota bacterium]|nr:transporter substrate-binding domain-containing protein [Actinomycetota bacterium]
MLRIRLIALFGALFLLIGAACGGEDTGANAPSRDTEDTADDAAEDNGEEATGLLAAVQNAGVLRVSTDPAYPPQSSLNEDGEYEGFDIDVATEIANRLGVEIAWETPAWDTITAGNWSGRWDVSVGSMTVTPERAEVLHFTPAYYYTPASVAVHADNTDITDVETDLDGKKIGVCSGCTYDFYLEKSLEIPGEEIEFVIDDAEIKGYDTDSSAINDLEIGDGRRLDAAISATPTLEGAVEKGKAIKIVGDPIFYEPLAVAIDRNAPEDPQPLVDAISAIIEEMHADGTLTELSMKWYGTDLTTKV